MNALLRSVRATATISVAITTGVAATLPFNPPQPVDAQDTAPAIETIRQSDLRADLYFLAGDELRGRLAGSPEGRVASAFIKSRFERLGLVPVGDGGSYYHNFNVARTEVGENNHLSVALAGGPTLMRARGQDLRGSVCGRGAVRIPGDAVLYSSRSNLE